MAESAKEKFEEGKSGSVAEAARGCCSRPLHIRRMTQKK